MPKSDTLEQGIYCCEIFYDNDVIGKNATYLTIKIDN